MVEGELKMKNYKENTLKENIRLYIKECEPLLTKWKKRAYNEKLKPIERAYAKGHYERLVGMVDNLKFLLEGSIDNDKCKIKK